ncbi:MAG: methylated-DNA--[protein]-cysteine S-methyltransferase [Mobiluncus porci]|uniref:methylated-DNA--[protein]-cysteine S-methyltransferase n=1 Tax=Mobiluncus porci TaxID=2652278 RepID=UPI0023F50D82|nr:methylated-DNA--[protein]-cysteine S-methyltransferase [Mobiluncus porci]MDD7541676.1 methylated-DNA--[protein]-cysteine S-methyltransferase [Mobiluncus porci]MDY5749247.1 methylated-DNA--[protein]-cysteine S-methyltransferase [Mobiluncus porci]
MRAVFSLRTGHPVIDSHVIEVEIEDYSLRLLRWVPRGELAVQQGARGEYGEALAKHLADPLAEPICSSTTPPDPMFEPFASALEDWEVGNQNAWRYQLDLLYPLDSDFRESVREALLRTRRGEVISYASLARRIREPKAVRAAASACATNPIALVVPCHRVVPSASAPQFSEVKVAVLEEVKELGSEAQQFVAKPRRKIPKRTLRLAAERLQFVDLGKYAFEPKLKRALVEFELAWKISETAKRAARLAARI